MKLYGAFTKVEENDDGTITVSGIASSGAQDDAGETVLPDAMKAALPEYMTFGAVREMHGLSAAGTALKATVDDAGLTHLEALVVDPLAIKKVQTGVYKGFSIGGKVLERDSADRTIIRAIKLSEISLVDRPCNPEAVIGMWKADGAHLEEDMTVETQAWAPTNEDVKARAAELAKAAGKEGKINNFLTKARATLIAEHIQAEAEAAEEVTPIAKADEPEDPEGGAAPVAAADPVAAVEAAIEKAKGAVVVVVDDTAAAIDLKKAGAALRLLVTRSEGVLSKGLYSVSRLAELIESLTWLQESVSWEAECERDGSTLPADLAGNVASLLTTLSAMVAEEAAEIVQAYADDGLDIDFDPGDAEVEIIAYASSLVDLAKADEALMQKVGARHSKADAQNIQDAHDALAKLGAMCDPGNTPAEDAEKAALVAERDGLAKALPAALAGIEDLGKTIAAQAEDLVKARTEFDAKLSERDRTIADLTKRFDEWGKRIAPARPLQPISKSQDADPDADNAGGGVVTADELKKYIDGLPEAERGQLLLRAALKQPILIPTAYR